MTSHGTVTFYRYGCRCSLCTAAKAASRVRGHAPVGPRQGDEPPSTILRGQIAMLKQTVREVSRQRDEAMAGWRGAVRRYDASLARNRVLSTSLRLERGDKHPNQT